MLLYLSLPQVQAAEHSTQIQQQLNNLKAQNEEIQAQIDSIHSEYDVKADEIQQLVDQKNAVDQEIGLLHAQIDNIAEQIRTYGQLIADSQDELDAQQEVLLALSAKHRERIRAMEEQGHVSYWNVVFQSTSFIDLLDRLNMVEEIAAADAKRLEDMRLAGEAVLATQSQLTAEKDGMTAVQEQLTQTEASLNQRRTQSDDLLRQLAKDAKVFQQLLDESEAKQDALMGEIAQKEKELQQAKYEEELVKIALRGQNPPSSATWQVPVSGYVITSAFGMRIHPVYGTEAMHNGVDMSCPEGTPIYATRSGTVTTASYQAGGAGYYVTISHGDGFSSIYMHMTHFVVSAGQSVSQGQLIGYVGNTGVSTGPHLHFGVSYAGTYVNPMAYI